MDEKTTKEVILEFNKKNVAYCILRNYQNIWKNKDLDILIDPKDGFKVKKILKHFGFVKRIWGWGPYILCDKTFDIKAGCLDCQKICIDESRDLLGRKRKHKYFYILGKEDELKHLIFKSLSKNFRKKKYLKKIKTLLEECNTRIVKEGFFSNFGGAGRNMFNAVRKGDYEKAIKYRGEMYQKINSHCVKAFFSRMKYIFYRLSFPCLKR